MEQQETKKRESITSSAIRSLVKTFFGVVGIALGSLIMLALVGGLFSGSALQVLSPSLPKYDLEVRTDANGQRKVLPQSAPVLLVLDITGVFGSKHLNAQTFSEQLQETKEGVLQERKIAGILLHINSPGGALPDIDGMYRTLKNYAEKNEIPVFAYTEGMALSGGYYLAAAAEKIYASPSALIGSIGVVMSPMVNFSETLKKLGMESVTVSSGEGKDLMNPVRPWKKDEQKPLEEISNFYYKQFVGIVAESRNLTSDTIVNTVKAGFYPSPIAEELGLVDDSNANMAKVIGELAEKAGIQAEPYQVVGMKRRINLFDDFFHEKSIFSGQMTHHIEVPNRAASGIDEKWGAPLALYMGL